MFANRMRNKINRRPILLSDGESEGSGSEEENQDNFLGNPAMIAVEDDDGWPTGIMPRFTQAPRTIQRFMGAPRTVQRFPQAQRTLPRFTQTPRTFPRFPPRSLPRSSHASGIRPAENRSQPPRQTNSNVEDGHTSSGNNTSSDETPPELVQGPHDYSRAAQVTNRTKDEKFEDNIF